MLKLNLVSQELKKELKLRHLYKFLKKVDYIFIIISIVIAIMLLTARVILQNNFNSVVEQTTQITKNSQSYNTKVREINAKISSVEQIQKDFVAWSGIFSELEKIANDGIVFASVRFNYNDKSAKFSGNAKTRDDLIAFKEQLEQSSLFKQIDFPVSNILEKTDINFDLNAKLSLPGA